MGRSPDREVEDAFDLGVDHGAAATARVNACREHGGSSPGLVHFEAGVRDQTGSDDAAAPVPSVRWGTDLGPGRTAVG